jgi:uncharacterized Fe-S cluster protein YjdI/CDGSH-type Zn-finger protein
MGRRIYENKTIRVFWNADKCIHASECVNGLPAVFDRSKRPWINVDAAGVDELTKVIDKCPSGALRYELLGGEATGEAVIRVLKNGPYRVDGKVQLRDEDGSVISTEECFILCRCGRSDSKPFCDGSHLREPGSSDGLTQTGN